MTGTPRSCTPRCSVTRIRCMRCVAWTDTSHNHRVRTTTTTTTTSRFSHSVAFCSQSERVLRPSVEHIVNVLPFLQILDVPVPQVVDQLVEFMQRLDTVTPVQVIAVPKISLRTESRSVLWTGVVRRRNCWWKCRLSCVVPFCSSSLPSRTWTFQFLAPMVIMVVFKVFPGQG